MSGFTVQELSPYFNAEAERISLVPPTIQVSETLGSRMLRHGRVLEFDESALLSGLTQVEVERPTQLYLDALPKTSKSMDPTLAFTKNGYDKPPEALIRLNPNIRADEAEKGAYKKLNTAFWSGIIVTSAMAEGTDETFERGKLHSDKTNVREHAVAMASNLAVNTSLHFGLGINFFVALGTGVGTQFAVYSGQALRTHRAGSRSFSERYLKQQRDMVNDLTQTYPVLGQGFALN